MLAVKGSGEGRKEAFLGACTAPDDHNGPALV